MVTFNNLGDWSDNFTKNQEVQPNETSGEEGGNFLSGESAVIVAGPSKIKTEDMTINEVLVPIGLVQQAQISQNKQINQVFEIGSSTPFFIPGRVNINASLSKILFDGPSLAYALYRTKWSEGEGESTETGTKVPDIKAHTDPYSVPSMPYPPGAGTAEGEGEEATVRKQTDVNPDGDSPGLFWINLASNLFNKPLGLGFMLYDMNGEAYGGAYLEGCFLRSHNFGISSNATVLAENVSLTAKRIRPISAANIGTVSNFYDREPV